MAAMSVHPIVSNPSWARREWVQPAPIEVMAWADVGMPMRFFPPSVEEWLGYPTGCGAPDAARSLGEWRKSCLKARVAWPPLIAFGRDPSLDMKLGGSGATMPGVWATTPGWHLPGRAVDFDLSSAGSQGTAAREKWVSQLVTQGAPHGWTLPIEITGEDNHFECHGVWQVVMDDQGWRQGAFAALLDLGAWRGELWETRAVQAQLWRVVPTVMRDGDGSIDGIKGTTYTAACIAAGVDPTDSPQVLLPQLYQLPTG